MSLDNQDMARQRKDDLLGDVGKVMMDMSLSSMTVKNKKNDEIIKHSNTVKVTSQDNNRVFFEGSLDHCTKSSDERNNDIYTLSFGTNNQIRPCSVTDLSLLELRAGGMLLFSMDGTFDYDAMKDDKDNQITITFQHDWLRFLTITLRLQNIPSHFWDQHRHEYDVTLINSLKGIRSVSQQDIRKTLRPTLVVHEVSFSSNFITMALLRVPQLNNNKTSTAATGGTYMISCSTSGMEYAIANRLLARGCKNDFPDTSMLQMTYAVMVKLLHSHHCHSVKDNSFVLHVEVLINSAIDSNFEISFEDFERLPKNVKHGLSHLAVADSYNCHDVGEDGYEIDWRYWGE